MDYLKLCLGLITLFGTLLKYLSEKQLLDAGQAEAVARAMKERADALDRATAVRKATVDRLKSVPGELPDDGFQRSD